LVRSSGSRIGPDERRAGLRRTVGETLTAALRKAKGSTRSVDNLVKAWVRRGRRASANVRCHAFVTCSTNAPVRPNSVLRVIEAKKKD
jgi:hypothetical protein